MKLETVGNGPRFIESSALTLDALGTNPLFTFILGKIEVAFKKWIREVLDEVQPVEEASKYLTRQETCERLHISLPTLSRYIDRGIIKGNKVGTRVLIREDELDEALSNMKRKKHE